MIQKGGLSSLTLLLLIPTLYVWHTATLKPWQDHLCRHPICRGSPILPSPLQRQLLLCLNMACCTRRCTMATAILPFPASCLPRTFLPHRSCLPSCRLTHLNCPRQLSPLLQHHCDRGWANDDRCSITWQRRVKLDEEENDDGKLANVGARTLSTAQLRRVEKAVWRRRSAWGMWRRLW